MRKARLAKLEAIVQKSDGHEFEVKSFCRLLLMKDSQNFIKRIKKFTVLDVFSIYQGLFENTARLYRLAKGLELPPDIEALMEYTLKCLKSQTIHYEDACAISYIKLKTFGADTSNEIKQVVIDEVQDYYPIQLAIMKELYGSAKYTVVGDIAQSIERSGKLSIYDTMSELLQKNKTARIFMHRSYRSSYEINEFAKRIMGGCIDSESFPRHETVPEVISEKGEEELSAKLVERLEMYAREGYQTIAILCKTLEQTKALLERLTNKTTLKFNNGIENETEKGCTILPVYAAKGLEYDAVLVYGVDDTNYCTELDRRLLYIACTRALHRLTLYYTWKKSRFL